MISSLIKLLVSSPFYPHWLDFKNKRKGNSKLNKYFKGKVLETGAGNCEKKDKIMKENKRIKEYIVTDYDSWDKNFKDYNKKSNLGGKLGEIIFGTKRNKGELDKVCDATKLPFKKESFDTYCSFEVLEHINEPLKFFKEAYRVLKPGGYYLLSVPFLYREHGGLKYDFQRFTRGGYNYLAKKVGFSKVSIYSEAYVGTTITILINQFIIRQVYERGVMVKIFLLPICPFLFFFFNIIGLILDLISNKDLRFSPYYHIILRK